jgi:hypothetical protein
MGDCRGLEGAAGYAGGHSGPLKAETNHGGPVRGFEDLQGAVRGFMGSCRGLGWPLFLL